jgi:hypothetical protein
LAYPCDHLSPQLGFNRFLAHLIHDYFTTGTYQLRQRSPITFMPGVSATRVFGYACSGPRTCNGATHTVELEKRPLCYEKPAVRTSATPPSCDTEVLVVRYGIDRSSITPPLPRSLLRFLNLHRSRHIPPYHPRP